MKSQAKEVDKIWRTLQEVKDPEIPVVSVVEMGIVRDIDVENGRVVVKMTPTFSACPALHVMKQDIEDRVGQLGHDEVHVQVVLNPPWTSDWITDEAREKLKRFGLAPPVKHGGRIEVTFHDLAECPYCGSNKTTLKNTFGPTLCRAIHYCLDCQQPFEQFKAL